MQDREKVNARFSGELVAFERLTSLNISAMFKPIPYLGEEKVSISKWYQEALLEHMPSYAAEANCRYCNELMDRFGACFYLDKDGTRRYVFWDLKEAPAEFETVFRIMIGCIESSHTFFDAVPFVGINPTAGLRERGGFFHYSFDFTKELAGRTPGEYVAGIREISGALRFMTGLNVDEIKGDVIPLMRRLSFDDKFIKAWEFIENTWTAFKTTRKLVSQNPTYTEDLQLCDDYINKVAADIIASAIINNGLSMYLRESSVLGPILAATPEALENAALIVLNRIDPMKYKRISREFTDAALAKAEKELKDAGLENVTKRRPARFADIERLTPDHVIWKAPAKKELSILAAIRSESMIKGYYPEKVNALEKRVCSLHTFINRYLPECSSLYLLMAGKVHLNGITVPEHDDTPIVFRHGDNISVYAYRDAQPLSNWGLTSGWVSITGIVDNTHMDAKETVGIIIDGTKDSNRGALGLWKDRLDTKMLSPLVVNTLAKMNETVELPDSEGSVAVFISNNSAVDLTFNATIDGKEVIFHVTAYE